MLTRENLLKVLGVMFLILSMMVSIPGIFAAGAESESGLVGYWKLDKGSGTLVTDSSGNGNIGTLLGQPSWVVGKTGKALQFNSVGDCVDCGNDSILAPASITVSLWGKRDSTIGWADTFITRPHGGWTSSYAIRKDRFIINFTTQGEKQILFTVPGFEEWTHYVLTYDGSNMRGYINGVEVSNSPVSVTDTILYSSAGDAPVVIGAHGKGGAGALNGAIDEVRIYNRALSKEEVKEQYGKGGAEPAK